MVEVPIPLLRREPHFNALDLLRLQACYPSWIHGHVMCSQHPSFINQLKVERSRTAIDHLDVLGNIFALPHPSEGAVRLLRLH